MELLPTRKFTVTKVWMFFMKFKRYSQFAHDTKHCEWCGHKFELEDMTHLAIIEKSPNKLICENCKDSMIKYGIETFTRKGGRTRETDC